jgi:CRP-like cAMP-binding protein
MAVHEVVTRLGELLQPLAAASAERRAAILEHARLVRYGSGQVIFKEGVRDSDCVYLVKGSVDTFSGESRIKRIEAGTPSAVVPLPDDQPRKVSARAATDVGLLLVPRSRLAPLLQGDDEGLTVEDIDEASDTGDWMTMLLRSALYAQLPVANIQRIMATMEAVPVKPGDVIVRQGEIGDFFFFLSKGRARVFRQAREGEPPVLLAELREGVSFGEEFLVAGIERNATVTMTTDGWVMRLTKHHFEELILEPTLNRIDWVAAETMVNDGAVWIDVRFPGEHSTDGLDSSLNIPLGMLRMRMPKLDRDVRYVVYCDNGQRSAAGAFLMAGSGFDVYVLEDGIITPGGIDTLDDADSSPSDSDSQAPDLSSALGMTPMSIVPDMSREQTPASGDKTAPDNTVQMAQQLKGTIDALRTDKASVENRVEGLESELRATREALKSERSRARDLVRELQHLRQSLTDIQAKTHAALDRERTAYERELSKAVNNLQKALADKEVELAVERERSNEEIERLRLLVDPGTQQTG